MKLSGYQSSASLFRTNSCCIRYLMQEEPFVDLTGNFPLFPKSLRPLTQDLVCFGATGPTWHIVAVRQGRVVFCKDCTNFVSPHVKHTTIHTFLEVLLRKAFSTDISGAGIGSSTFEDEEINMSVYHLCHKLHFGLNMKQLTKNNHQLSSTTLPLNQ